MTEPNNNFNQATFVPDIYLEQNFYTSDSISPSDLDDYFAFYTLYGPSTLYASLLGLSADADLYVYDQNQNLVASSTNGGNTSETINVALLGNQYYYVKVHNYISSNSTNYGLYLYNDYSGPTLGRHGISAPAGVRAVIDIGPTTRSLDSGKTISTTAITSML